MKQLFMFLVCVLAISARAAEPAYCDLKTFMKREIRLTNNRLERARGFKIGKLTLVGLGVGNSDAADTAAMAEKLGQVDPGRRFCTWYLNKGNEQAERRFKHIYLPNPRSMNVREAYNEYADLMGDQFGEASLSFTSCAEERGFIALGCDGMKHRGPTVFGMLLAYSGCSPENAAKIANALYDLNGVKPEVRLSAIRAGYDLGQKDNTRSARLRKLMEDTP